MTTHPCAWCGADAELAIAPATGPAELACEACGVRVPLAADPIDPVDWLPTAA